MSPRKKILTQRVRRWLGNGAIITWGALTLLAALLLAGLGVTMTSDPSPGNTPGDRVWGWWAIVTGALIGTGALGVTIHPFFRQAALRMASVALLAAGVGCGMYLVVSASHLAREASGDFAAMAAMGSALMGGVALIAGCTAVIGIVVLLVHKSR